MIVIIAIIGALSSIIAPNFIGVMENAKVSTAGSVQRAMTKAVEMYYIDMGFYPPDVNRGWDPGLAQKMPWSPDAPAEGSFSTSGENCSHCPPDWQNIVAQNWRGPYLPTWPQFTPWKGKYDYNYWPVEGTIRYGCPAVPGVYMGVEKDYYDNGDIPSSAEIKMGQYGFDVDCIDNGEAQMLLRPL